MAITDIPASINELEGWIVHTSNVAGATTATDTVWGLPLMEGSISQPEKSFERSPVLRADRQGGSQIGGTSGASGTVVVPMKEDVNVRELLANLFRGAWVTTTIEGDATGLRLTPGSTRKTFTLEMHYRYYNSGGTAIDVYERCKNAEVSRCVVQIPTSGGPALTIDVLGTQYEIATAPVYGTNTGALREVDTATIPMASSITGAALKQADNNASTNPVDLGAESGQITIDNNMEIKYRVGSDQADHVAQGDFDVEAQMSLYYRGSTFAQQFTSETRKSYEFIFKASGDATRCRIRLGSGVITQAPKGTSGQTVNENVNIFAEYSSFTSGKASIEFYTV